VPCVVKGKWQLELQLTNIYLAETKVNGVWGRQWVKTLGHIKHAGAGTTHFSAPLL